MICRAAEVLVIKIDKRMQERDGIASAGDRDEVTARGRKFAKDFFNFNELQLRRHSSNVERSTLNVQRRMRRR